METDDSDIVVNARLAYPSVIHHSTGYRLVTAKRGDLWSIALVRGFRCIVRSDWMKVEDGEELRDRFVNQLENLHEKVATALYDNNQSRHNAFWGGEH